MATAKLYYRELVGDVLLTSAVAVGLAPIHFGLSASTTARLSLSYQHLRPVTLFTSAFVHHSTAHLLDNLGGYLVAAGCAMLLCHLSGEQEWFRRTLLTLVGGLPVLVNSTSYLVWAPRASGMSRGFSSVAAGFVGFLVVTLVVWIAVETSWLTAQYIGMALVLGLSLEVSLLLGGMQPLVVMLAFLGFLLCGWGLFSRCDWPQIGGDELLVKAGLAVGIILLLGGFMPTLFPRSITGSGPVVDIVGHALGILYGGSIAALVYRWG